MTFTEKDEIDIEKVLWALKKLQNVSAAYLHKGYFPGWLMQPEKFAKFLSPGGTTDNNVINMRKHINNIKVDTNRLMDEIYDQVYSLYGKYPTDDQVSNWEKMILMCHKLDSNSHIEIFTTNYDLVIDKTIRDMEEGKHTTIETGRIYDGLQTNFNQGFWEVGSDSFFAHTHKGKGLLTKLHGSVDWHRHSEESKISCYPPDDKSRGDDCIIQPGHKGRPTKAPFNLFYDYLERMSKIATGAIFIGFSFRDEEINKILSNIDSEVPKILINPDPDKNLFSDMLRG